MRKTHSLLRHVQVTAFVPYFTQGGVKSWNLPPL
jgi:hypothetical protein